MSHPRILCLGEILIDCLRDLHHPSESDSQPDSQSGSQPDSQADLQPDSQNDSPQNLVTSWTLQPGGAPANVACALAKLGVTVGLISAIGDDTAGRSLLELLDVNRVDRAMVACLEAAMTRHVLVERDATGDRRFVGFGSGDPNHDPIRSANASKSSNFSNSSNSSNVSVQFADALIDVSQVKPAAIVRADWLVTGTLGLAVPTTAKAIRQTVGMAKQSMTSVFVDVNWRSVFWVEFDGSRPGFDEPDTPRDRILRFLTQADWLKFSDDDARFLLDTDDVAEIAARFPSAQGIIVTRGDRGCGYQVGEMAGELPAFKVAAIDTTGAGDSFVAAFLAQWVDRGAAILSAKDAAGLREVMRYACAAGALTTLEVGAIAAQPTREEILALL